jgi:hypothetical protein
VNDPTSTDYTDNDANADEAPDTDESAEKDVDPDWKPSSDANQEDPEDEDVEYDEDEPPISKVRRGAPKVDVASLPKGAATKEAESESDDDFFPAIDDEMDVSDFHQFPAVECVKCHDKLEGRVPIVDLGEFSCYNVCSLFKYTPENFTTTNFFQQNYQT